MLSLIGLLALVPGIYGAPVEERQADGIIPGKWLVELRPDIPSVQEAIDGATASLRLAEPIEATSIYEFGSDDATYRGFALDASDDLAELLSTLPEILSVEPDRIVSIDQTLQPSNENFTVADDEVSAAAIVEQHNAPWNLARLSHRPRIHSSHFYHNSAAHGTIAYILDTGVYIEHSEFGGRAAHGANFSPERFFGDAHGHGTHVAGTVGAHHFGVAKATHVVNVKVLGGDGRGSLSGVLNGVQWCHNHMVQHGLFGLAVTNLSLGFQGHSQQLTNMIDAATRSGLVVVAAAGNENQDARNVSPANAPSACTVGATDINDFRAIFSNVGPAVDIFAPGVSITSLGARNPHHLVVLSGTSMAAPLVAGTAAYFARLERPRNGVEICDRLRQLATRNIIQDARPGSPNLLVYNDATF